MGQYCSVLAKFIAVYVYVSMYLCMYVSVFLPLVELRLKKPPNDPDALLQQKIPKSYLILQKEVHKLALSMEQTNEAPIMNKQDF